jgi:hypothetical protein
MKRIGFAWLAWFVAFAAGEAMAIDEAPYKVVETNGTFELREYAPHILAETLVVGTLEEAGNQAFNTLFKYISGDNSTSAKVAMTAPVSQQSAGEKIKMTAPVGQVKDGGKWAVSFMMPTNHTLKTLPVPNSPNILLREVPARQMAAVRYSGTWSEKNYRLHLAKLQAWMVTRNLVPTGDPIWARYNPPFKPWFLRRNEILIPVKPGERK